MRVRLLMSAEKKFSQKDLDGGLVRTDIFDLQKNRRFGVGIFDSESVVNYTADSIQEAYLKFRADVYVDKTRILDSNQKRPDGTEVDNDDERSTHIVAFENKIGSVAIVGCMRLPEKTDQENQPLPIELFFPELFPDGLPTGSKEASRFIVSYENLAIRSMIKRRVLMSAVAYTSLDKENPVYAVVEDNLKRDLISIGVPLETLGPAKMIEKYHSVNFPIKIDQHEFASRLGQRAISLIDTSFGSVSFFGKLNEQYE